MTEITRHHAEWAVVDRFRSMLNEVPHSEYNVTQSYGLCVAILAWVMQRIRTHEEATNSQEDKTAIALKTLLDLQMVESLPWGLKTNAPPGSKTAHSDFINFSAFDFLKWLRDASCHGDARKITPVNDNGELIGFHFQMTARDNIQRALLLTEKDLRRIGSSLADMYCKALQSVATSHPATFIEDARSMREERRVV